MNFEDENQCFPDAKILRIFCESSWSICIANTLSLFINKREQGHQGPDQIASFSPSVKILYIKDKLTKDNLLHVLQSRTWIAYKLRTMRPSWRCLKALLAHYHWWSFRSPTTLWLHHPLRQEQQLLWMLSVQFLQRHQVLKGAAGCTEKPHFHTLLPILIVILHALKTSITHKKNQWA